MNKPSKSPVVNDNITIWIIDIYKSYIEPNFALLIIISLISFVLYQRYLETLKQKNINERFDSKSEVDDILDKLDKDTNKTLNPGIGNIPTFNPLYSVGTQQGTKYPDNIPMNINGNGLIYSPKMNPPATSFGNLYDFQYNYNNVNENPTRNYFSGGVNTYQNAKDTTLQNPPGYIQNYNTSTNDFGQYATDHHNKTITDYNEILTRMNSTLVDNLQTGPMNLNIDLPEPTMEPPYATE